MKKTALHEKLLFEEELDDLDIDDIGNFEDLSRLVFIDEECGNPRVSSDDGELDRNINLKKTLVVIQAYK